MKKNPLGITTATASIALLGFVALIACKPMNNMATANDGVFEKDLNGAPSSVQGEKQIAQGNLSSAKKQMFSKGCKTTGDSSSVAQLDPNLVVGDNYVREEIKTVNPITLDLKYDLSLYSLPATNGGALSYTGELETISLTNFLSPAVNSGDMSVTKKCELLDATSGFEKCFAISANYSAAFLQARAQAFQADAACKMTLTSATPLEEKWSTAQMTMANNQNINVYIHRTRNTYLRTCGGSSAPQNVAELKVVMTSNDVVSSHYAHCGGELMYSKTTIRGLDHGAALSTDEFIESLAPLAPTPVTPAPASGDSTDAAQN